MLTTGLPGLDRALRKGVPVGAISEFVGPAGVGELGDVNFAQRESEGFQHQ